MATRTTSTHNAGAWRSGVVTAGLTSLAVGTVIMAVKFAAAFLTGSTALLADAGESIVNVVAGALLTYSLLVSRRPPDDDHPYGHGKAESLSAMVEGSLILVASSVIVAQAIRQLVAGPELSRLGIGIAISAAAGLANLGLGAYLWRVARSEASEALRADAIHVLTDTLTTAAGIVALGLVWVTGLTWIDPVAGLLVAANIVFAGWTLIRRALGGLLDEADFELLAAISERIDRERRDEWCEVHQLRAWSSGPVRHLDLHLVLPRYFTLEQAHTSGDTLESVLMSLLGDRGDVVMHVDPCRPQHCAGCAVAACAVRSTEYAAAAPFDVESLTRKGEI